MAAIGYKAALRWIVWNDDTEWLDGDEKIPSVTAVFLADVYGKPVEKVTADLARLRQAERDAA